MDPTDNWENDYMEYPSPKAAASGEDFELSYVSSKYKVIWKQNTGKFAETQSVTEGKHLN